MTRNKLMAKIEDRFEEDNHHLLKDALRAVVEVHRPDEDGFCSNSCHWFEENKWGGDYHFYKYPCPTIEAIEKGLK